MLNKAQQLMEKFGSIATPPNLFKGYGDNADLKSQFPVKLGSTDPDDKRYNLQNQLVGANASGAVAGYGQAVLDSTFFDWAKRKQEQATLHDFYGYMLNNADLQKPESAQWWFSKFPWMKDLRLQEIDREAEVQKRLAKIQVCGPEDEEDFMVLFLKKQGLLRTSGKPLYELGDVKEGPDSIYKNPFNFKPGYFNPFARSPQPTSQDDVRLDWKNPVSLKPPTSGTAIPSAFPTPGFTVKQAINVP